MGDHLVAYKWRNNPEVWKFTGSRPDIYVTEEIEEEWLRRVLQQKDAMRYAICISGTDEYIGNVTLTDIGDGKAEFHTHIGEVKYWGKGISTKATKMMLQKGFDSGLEEIYLYVHKDNKQAINVYLKCGFSIVDDETENLKMTVQNNHK